MPFQQVPDTVLIEIIGTLFGETVENTFYGQMDGGYALADVEAMAAAADAWVAASFLPTMPDEYAYLRSEVHGLNSAIDLEATNADSAGPGGFGDTSCPSNVTLAVKRSSGFSGRGARGRIYWPAIPESQRVGTNVVDGAYTDLILTVLDAMDTAIESVGFVPVIVHRVSAGVPLVPAVLFTLVEWVVVNNVIDSMRRRLPGRGI